MAKKEGVPAHIGIIMDGNGRWAQSQGLLRTQGHLEGLKAAKRVVKAARDLGVSWLTLYTFSTENWKRSAAEVSFIMGLVRQYLREELGFYRQNGIRIRHAGSREGLPPEILAELDAASRETEHFGGMQVILALNYGGRDEIIRAVRKLFDRLAVDGNTAASTAVNTNAVHAGSTDRDAAAGSAAVTEESFRRCLDCPDVPDPDLVIRSAGEFRTSNFLLWESAYTEYYVSEKLWPDWDGGDLERAVSWFSGRERRYGGAET